MDERERHPPLPITAKGRGQMTSQAKTKQDSVSGKDIHD